MDVHLNPAEFALERDPSGRVVWTEAARGVVFSMLDGGASYSAAAEKLGVSRCAIAGIVGRCGWRAPKRIAVSKPKPKAIVLASAPATHTRPTKAIEPSSPPQTPAGGVSLLDLRLGQCRCVVGHDGALATYCGARTAPESSWCPEHKQQFTRTSATAWERAAVRIKKGNLRE